MDELGNSNGSSVTSSPQEFSYAKDLYTALADEIEERRKYQNEAQKPTGANILNVLSVDLNIAENTLEHHTDEYEQVRSQPFRLIIRRGQEFLLTLHCNRAFKEATDAILLEFNFGCNPTVERMTKRLMEVQPKNYTLTWKWGVKLDEVVENKVIVRIKSNASSPVGEWSFAVHTGRRRNDVVTDTYVAYTHPNYIYILFNAWSPDDPVFLDNEDGRQEYVLSDHGAVWQGAKYGQYSACPWNFGQFEDVSLYAALVALRQGRYLTDEERAGPVLVSRRLTAAVNDNILQGRWSEPYSDGTKPWEWTGSAAILEKFISSPNRAVKYGQCWVFSAVLVTLCRALGIPCRSVTNVRSAHDTDRTLTIDHVYLRDPITGKFEEDGDVRDSVWNFHVWNEIWCKRLDLPPGFDGWQACDATPQEMSSGRYQCGPMSVKALRLGELLHNYDGWFIYGEMNADVVNWYYALDPKSPGGKRLLKAETDTRDVGRCIITSAVGNPMKAVDLTDEYKAKEGTEEERRQIKHAVHKAVAEEREDILDLFQCKEKQPDDIEFEFSDLEEVILGEPITGKLKAVNTGKAKRTVKMHLELYVLRYTGVTCKKVMEVEKETQLKTGQIFELTLEAYGTAYGHLLQEHSQMCMDAMATVLETEQIFIKRDVFQVAKPLLYIEGNKDAEVNYATTVTICFTNPINEILTNCSLRVEGCGLTAGQQLTIKCPQELPGCGSFQIEHSILPRKAGKRSLLAVFSADQLANLRGVHVFDVTEHS